MQCIFLLLDGHRKNLSLDHSIAPDNPTQSKSSVKPKQSTGSLDSAVGTISKSDASKFVGPSHPGKPQKTLNSPCGYLPAPGESSVNLPLNTRGPNEPRPCPPAPQSEKHSDNVPVSPNKIKPGVTLQNSEPIKPTKPDLPGRSNKSVDSGSQSMPEAKPKEQPNSEFDNANVSITGASSNQNVQTKRPVERFARSQTQTGPNMPSKPFIVLSLD